ncbi:2'-5' RNA ligase family protein [Nocardioides sp. BP30]|uniref:2'-5' RNA ligase family protein n=1 Tax=Nocardioides sp. BP30 TaxID=3036374 RepID=UPI002469424F|nr:2'-5' RNA ligase family protein [Nocardioides sp. BP30]WGL51724.1 2'-5' RNA ligase family protein [Nocardioides sp. BP30]
MRTIGVAVPIPEPWGSRLQRYRESIGDPMAEHIPPHITLVPPVDLAPSVAAEVERHLGAAAEAVTPFTVHLRGTATFRPLSPVVFVALAEGISGCERLEHEVRSGPLGVDLAYPYHPHVTIAHEVDDAILDRAFADLADFEARFEVESFVLYVHDDVAGWVPSRTFPLRAVVTR